MTASARAEVLNNLEEAAKQLNRLETLLEQGDSIGILHTLIEVRRPCQQATIALLAGCLQRALAGAQSDDPAQREGCLENLVRLAAFAQSRLCEDCRGRLSAALKKV
mgnify:CR=1 FL=1